MHQNAFSTGLAGELITWGVGGVALAHKKGREEVTGRENTEKEKYGRGDQDPPSFMTDRRLWCTTYYRLFTAKPVVTYVLDPTFSV